MTFEECSPAFSLGFINRLRERVSVCEKAYMVVLEKVFIIRWDSELEEGVFTIVWCSGVVTGPSMLTMDQQNLRLNKSSKIHLFILILQCFTFLVWSVRSTIHACIIWISKLVPVLGWNAEQPLYNLEGNKRHTIFTIKTKLVSKNFYLCKNLKAMCCLISSLNSTLFFIHCTLGCLFVSCRMVMGSGSGTAWPTRVGPNTRAKLFMSILFSTHWDTLGKDKGERRQSAQTKHFFLLIFHSDSLPGSQALAL